MVPRRLPLNHLAREQHNTGREFAIGPGYGNSFNPKRFKDTYAVELRELVNKKAKGQRIEIPKGEPAQPSNVVNLMDALKKSLSKEKAAKPAARAKRKSAK